MTKGSICGHEKDDGQTCEADFGLCPDCGKCWSHCPHRAEERQEARKRGGQATKRRYGATGLRDEELPPLESPQAAERWLEIVGRAVGTGRLAYQDGKAVVMAVKEFLRAHERGAMEEELQELREQVAELRRGSIREA